MTARGFTVRGILLAAIVGAVPAAAAELPSYEASYNVRLVRSTAANGPRAVSGILVNRFAEMCDGWDTRTLTHLIITYRDGSTFVNERRVSTLEAKDGRRYSYTARTVKNGISVEAFRGEARMNARGGGGAASYEGLSDPSRRYTVRLPRGTLLPVAYYRTLIDRARAGNSGFSGVIFNGASSTGPRLMSVAIGTRAAAADTMAGTHGNESLVGTLAPAAADLLDTPSWPMSFALFNLHEKQRKTPNFELSVRYHESGVMQSIRQDFGKYALSAELESLTRLEAPVCP